MRIEDQRGDEHRDDEIPTIALRRGLGALGDAAMPAPGFDDLISAHRPPNRGRRSPRLVASAGILATAAVLVLGLLVVGRGWSDGGGEVATAPFPTAGWERVADGPLSARNYATVVWTGREALVVGGDAFTCGGDCDAPDTPLLADGAAYDPATDRWREIADAPFGFVSAPAAALGDEIYFSAADHRSGRPAALLRYSVADDTWTEVPVPDGLVSPARLVAVPGGLVGYTDSQVEGDRGSDWLYQPTTGTWVDVPTDPLGQSFLRTMVWAGDTLWLFARSADDVESGRPPVTKVAGWDPDTGGWRRGPDSDMLTTGPWLVEGTTLVNPSLGCIDGTSDEDWGRCVPNGGRFDTATGTWMDLPDEPEAGTRAVVSSGAVGSTEAVFLDPGAHLLDAAFGRWETMPAIPGDGDEVVRELVAIGADAFTFGSDDDRLALADGWIWRSGRQPQPEPQPEPVTPTPTSSTTGETTTSATSSTTAPDPTSTSTGSTTTTIATIPTTVGPGSTGQGWRDDPVVANSPVCVPGELPPGVDGSSPIYFWNLGDPFEGRLDLITGSTVYTAVDCSWIPVLDLEREPGVRDWRCQQYEDGSEIELWDFTEGTVTEFPAGGGNGPMENYQRPDQLFGLASCDRSNPRNAAPSV